MDDLITGFDDLETAQEVQSQLQTVLKSCGFNLRKWCANHPALFKNLSKDDIEYQWDFQISETVIKTLGLVWNPKQDEFKISSKFSSPNKKLTKRVISSECGQIFDPLGLVNPTVVLAKLVLQNLWSFGVDWDQALPKDIQDEWNNFREQLPSLNNLNIPRRVLIDNPVHIELHGFADASEKAYGAALYIKSTDISGNTDVHLLGAKSKVAPIRKITLARLELCAAKLLVEFVDKVKKP